jgi:hypothetical protein
MNIDVVFVGCVSVCVRTRWYLCINPSSSRRYSRTIESSKRRNAYAFEEIWDADLIMIRGSAGGALSIRPSTELGVVLEP